MNKKLNTNSIAIMYRAGLISLLAPETIFRSGYAIKPKPIPVTMSEVKGISIMVKKADMPSE